MDKVSSIALAPPRPGPHRKRLDLITIVARFDGLLLAADEAGGAATGDEPRPSRSHVSARTVERLLAVGATPSRNDAAVKTKESSYGTFGEHG